MDEVRVDDVRERGRRIIDLLLEAGKGLGFESAGEYPVPGGRVDVVWLWQGPPEFPSRLPVVAFEVESSWRTRKHLKGDFLNLTDLQPALGVIVLLGEGEDVEGTRRFLRKMLDGRPGRIEVWAEGDVLRLLQGGPKDSEDVFEVAVVAGDTLDVPTDAPVTVRHSGKYRRLAQWLAAESRDRIEATFADVEEVLGFPLPPSSRRHEAHWYGYDNTAVGRAIRDAGWRVRNARLSEETLTFERERH